ncbi:peptidase S8 family protein [Metarhizium robertsii]|uniref:KP-43 peptidase, Serine peptidase, MEROPS family S08A n=2 Tax=Metarhizium robertsii TaxID=568076 RepID=E9EST9_METRA|nr:KP-43 peptidase, Serine peptidase, MEROPS family S08A [Metarhizium robertsii ARSEF 23]EFZ01962.2 KP-43 peptidase, Serine peptidase, MEROPS family S08A [Metarhizium robertsii ARSEF 23]EXV02472.1 peptidase S8 family protein [Metarhizium robertsii]
MSTQVIVNGNELSTAVPSTSDTSSTNFIVVRGTRRIIADDKRELAKKGAAVTEYLGNDIYLCHYEPSNLQPIRDLEFVAQANIFPHDVKKSRSIVDAIKSSESEGHPKKTFDVEIFLHKGEKVSDSFINDLREKTGIVPKDIVAEENVIKLTADASTIDKIVEVDAIKAIEQSIKPKLFNDISREDIGIVYPRVSPLGVNYEGQGQVIAIADTGFDTGSKDSPHPAFRGSIVALLSNKQRAGRTDDPVGHGTHVAGSALGDGWSDTMGGSIQGAAPKASLVLQSILDSDDVNIRIPRDLTGLFDEAYSTDVIVFAAGNDGEEMSYYSKMSQIGSTSAAKNSICVGATESRRPSIGQKYDPGGFIGHPDKIAYTSSRGPTFHKIIKPDVVAPGVAILSTCSRHEAMADRRQYFGQTDDNNWMFYSGTSMAAPLVSGCCAVLREALQSNNKTASPSAALVKALLINGADDLKLPKPDQGFGRVNLKESLRCVVESGPGEQVDWEQFGFEDVGGENALKEGKTWPREPKKIDFTGDHTGTLKVTLAYSDPPGENLQNNLILKVVIEQQSGVSEEQRGDEGFVAENNVEQVKWDITSKDKAAWITVIADRIAQLDGLQPFAVVWGIY